MRDDHTIREIVRQDGVSIQELPQSLFVRDTLMKLIEAPALECKKVTAA